MHGYKIWHGQQEYFIEGKFALIDNSLLMVFRELGDAKVHYLDRSWTAVEVVGDAEPFVFAPKAQDVVSQ